MAGRKKMNTTNDRKSATEAYLASLGLAPDSVPGPVDPTTTELAYDAYNMKFQGEAFDRLSGEYEFYRASKACRGKSIEAAKRAGYVELPDSADVRLKGCHDGSNDVYMIRRKERGDQERAREVAARERRSSVASTSVPGFAGSRVHLNQGSRSEETVYLQSHGGG
jgi:hypothetical protein